MRTRFVFLGSFFWTIAQLSCAASAQPFDLRGIRLGITLSEFRKTPFPDGGPVKVLCRGDADAKLLLDLWPPEREQAAGAIGCGYFRASKTYPNWQDANLKVGTVGVWLTYYFVPDEANVPRLYKIMLRSNVRYFDTFWEAYTGRYGQPTKLDRTPVQNKMGASFDNVFATWENAESAIFLHKRAEEVERTRIIYAHKVLAVLIDQRETTKKGRPKDNL